MQVESSCQYDIITKKLLTFENEDIPAELKNDIKAIAKNEGFIHYDVRIKKLPVNGGNYTAELYEIDIIGATANGGREINLFAKQQLKVESGDLKDIIDVADLYHIEKFAYKELSKVFDELQATAKIPVDERYKMVKYYESNPTTILMDNLRKHGYKMYSRTDVVSLDYAELAIENLAKFHALSFVMENNKPDFFDSKIKTLKYPGDFTETWKNFQKSVFNISMSYLEDELRNRVEDTIFKRLNKYRKYFENSERLCLCHGDYRVMNLMMREVEGKITDLMTLDYQILNYGNPLMDFVYFICTATDSKFRSRHLSYLKDTYYQTMKYFLKHFDMDVEECLPRDKFEKIYEETLDYGLIVMMTIMPLMFAEESDVPDLSNSSLSGIDFKVHDNFKYLLKDLVEDFIDWGCL